MLWSPAPTSSTCTQSSRSPSPPATHQPCQAAVPDNCPVPGEEMASKSIPWAALGWWKDLRVLMDPWGSSWAQPVSSPNALGLTKPSFLMG